MPNIKAERLHDIVRDLLLASGADHRNADRVAEALVSSNLCGVDSHGVFHLPRYIDEIKRGILVPTAWPQVVKETPASALISGNWTFGHVAAKRAMEIAIEKASAQGVAVVSLVRSMHIGRLGEYAEMAASAGMVSQIFVSGEAAETPLAVPFGGREPVLHTNPIAIGVPGDEEPAMVLDFATTVIAGSKVGIAQNLGEQVPPGWLVDGEGNPTTNPSGFPDESSLMPFGGHKGYAIMLAIEFLGRVFAGADAFTEGDLGGVGMRHQGVTMIVMKAGLFQSTAQFGRGSDTLQRRIRAVPPSKGFESVMVPGDLENRARAIRRRDGIPVPDEMWSTLVELGSKLGVEVE